MSDNESENEIEEKVEVTTCENPDVVTKYKQAAEIANAAVKLVMDACKPDTSILDLCKLGDEYILAETAKLYNKKKGKVAIEKGLGFPTCISPNHVCGHLSPLTEEEKLKEGDFVKIDLGVHIDGFAAVVAHTFLLGKEGANASISGRQADVLMAAYKAAEAMVRTIKPGNTSTACTDIIAKIAKDYEVEPLAGVLTHQTEKYSINSAKVIMNRKEEKNDKADEHTFAPFEAYGIDVAMSTGEGKPTQSSQKPTVYMRSDAEYQLKMKASRAIFFDIKKRFPVFPFSVRSLDKKTSAFGIKECMNHDLLHPFPVLLEQEGVFVAHVKCTVLLLANGTMKITGLPFDLENIKSEHTISDKEIVALLETNPMKKKKKKNNKKKKKVAA